MTAETESPPPTKEKEPLLVATETYSPILIVPPAKLGNSNTPRGPFHKIVLDDKTIFLKGFFYKEIFLLQLYTYMIL